MASGFAGQLTADLYDQALLGKEGLSSAFDYLKATGEGAASGLLLSGVLTNYVSIRGVFGLCTAMLAVLLVIGKLWMEPKHAAPAEA